MPTGKSPEMNPPDIGDAHMRGRSEAVTRKEGRKPPRREGNYSCLFMAPSVIAPPIFPKTNYSDAPENR